jgi:hypothetical protein
MSSFQLGALTFPATDSLLADLGHNVEELGTNCIGLVVEERTSKARVYFAALDLTVWLDHSEMKDIGQELAAGNLAFDGLNFDQNPAIAKHPSVQGHWWIDQLEPIEILETQSGTLAELWSKEDGPLSDYFEGDPDSLVFKLSVGIEELDLAHWKSLEFAKKDDLALVRFLPAGMHKLEIQIFLKWNKT